MFSSCRCSLALAAGLLLLPPSTVEGQIATRVADINPRRSEDFDESGPRGLVTLGNRVFFSHLSDPSPDTWWVSDGTEAGTDLLVDPCPGSCGTRIVGSTGELLFWTTDLSVPVSGLGGLWRSDGTTEGTFLLAPSRTVSSEGPLLIGERVFFVGRDDTFGQELWVTDGTVAGTLRVADLNPATGGSNPDQLTALGERVLFVAREGDTATQALWLSDGTAAGTTKVLPIEQLGARLRGIVGLANGALLLTGDGFFGNEAWVTDGTAQGTRKIPLPAPAAQRGGGVTWAHAVEGQGYIAFFAAGIGSELWETDGTLAGSRRISNLPSSQFLYGGSDIGRRSVARLHEKTLFLATDGEGRRITLWMTDGNPNHTTRLVHIEPELFLENRTELVRVGEKVYFIGRTAATGRELWASDGTVAGTGLVSERCPGPCGATYELTPVGNRLYFLGENPASRHELWRAGDGITGVGAVAALPGSDPFRQNLEIAALDSTRLVFRALDPDYGSQLFVSRGHPGTERRLTSVPPPAAGSSPEGLVEVGGRLVFWGCDGEHRRLWSALHAASEPVALSPAERSERCRPRSGSPQKVSGGKAFSLAVDPNTDRLLLWITDGTPEGTTAVDLGPPYFPTEDLDSAEWLGELYFFTAAPAGSTLWRTDGTPGGTVVAHEFAGLFEAMVIDSLEAKLIFTAAEAGQRHQLWSTDAGSSLDRLTDLPPPGVLRSRSNHLKFQGSLVLALGVQQGQLWQTDGTPGGTRLLKALPISGVEFGVFDLRALGETLLFRTGGDFDDQRLWRSDGTPEGTLEVRRFGLAGGLHHLRRDSSVELGGKLYFAAADEAHGRELWQSDGTEAGTVLAVDLLPGPASSTPRWLTVVGERLFLAARHQGLGEELWVSDGTPAGSRLLHDLAPGSIDSTPESFAQAGGCLFFSANDDAFGRELWSLDPGVSPEGCPVSSRELYFLGSRFRIDVAWRDFEGRTGHGTGSPLGNDSGYYWFFNPQNPELIVKVLDGRPVNGHFWTFYGAVSNVEFTTTVTDLETGLTQRYVNPRRRFASVGDTESFGPNGASFAPRTEPLEELLSADETPLLSRSSRALAGGCVPSPTVMCLNGGRFAVEVSFKDFQGTTGRGGGLGLSDDSATFWFFRRENLELLVKVLDGRPVNGKFWVFYGALSNVEYTLRVTDTETGMVKTYFNPSRRFGSVGDTGAF